VQGNTTGALAGTFMFEIMQKDVIRVLVYMPQDAAFGVTPGIEAIVRVPELPDREFPGTVTRIADAQQSGTRTLLTEIDLPNLDGALRSGVYFELRIPRTTPSFVVPAEAIIFNRNGLQVAVVKDGKVDIRKVRVTRDLGTRVEVDTGVQWGDQGSSTRPSTWSRAAGSSLYRPAQRRSILREAAECPSWKNGQDLRWQRKNAQDRGGRSGYLKPTSFGGVIVDKLFRAPPLSTRRRFLGTAGAATLAPLAAVAENVMSSDMATATLTTVAMFQGPPLFRVRCIPLRQGADQRPCEAHAAGIREEARPQ
jgi:hypothetical protein